MQKKYLVIGEGEYSSYSVYFIEKSENLSNEEHLKLLNFDCWDRGEIMGEFVGEWIETPGALIETIKINSAGKINRFFGCYSNRKYSSIVDRIYSKEELLDICIENDASPKDYWKKKVEENYADYLKVMELYFKI